MHRYTEANAEFQRLYALSLEDAGYTPPSSRNATATSEQSRPPWNPALTTTLIAWTWGGHSRPTRWRGTRAAPIAGSWARGGGAGNAGRGEEKGRECR